MDMRIVMFNIVFLMEKSWKIPLAKSSIMTLLFLSRAELPRWRKMSSWMARKLALLPSILCWIRPSCMWSRWIVSFSVRMGSLPPLLLILRVRRRNLPLKPFLIITRDLKMPKLWVVLIMSSIRWCRNFLFCWKRVRSSTFLITYSKPNIQSLSSSLSLKRA